MSTYKKITGQSCPECGSTNIKGFFDEVDFYGVTVHCACRNCDAHWRETYNLSYAGYEYKDKGYDENGNLEYDESED